MSQNLKLPSQPGLYRIQLVAPKSRERFDLNIEIECPREVGPKAVNLGGLGVVGDVTAVANTNLDRFNRQQFEAEQKYWQSRGLRENEGYSNLAHLLTGCGNKNNAISEKQRAAGFV